MKPAHQAEHQLIQAILEGRFAPGTRLPGERELAALLGVTRPTLRETLSRMGRDGWLTIRHGKATMVNDYLHEGGLNVLNALVHTEFGSRDLVTWLLQVRLDLAPAYTALAVSARGPQLIPLLEEAAHLAGNADAYAAYDWELHHRLTVLSGNPVYSMILNGFRELYRHQGPDYFAEPDTRAASQTFYAALLGCCADNDGAGARRICFQAMSESLHFWEAKHDKQTV